MTLAVVRTLFLVGSFAIFAGSSFAQRPLWSRGIQLFPVNMAECQNRARGALSAEGYTIDNQGSSFGGDFYYAGYKGQSTAVIACNSLADGQTWANVFTNTPANAAAGSTAGDERVKIQRRLGVAGGGTGGGSTGDVGLTGEWDLKCCNDGLSWTLTLKQEGSTFTGSFSGGWGLVKNGVIRGNTIEFDRVDPGGAWQQHWVGELVNTGGRLTIANGTWSGFRETDYPRNWRAAKK